MMNVTVLHINNVDIN